MRSIKCLFLTICLLLTLCSCIGVDNLSHSSISDFEKKLLAERYGTEDELKCLENGKLYDYQKEELLNVRECLTYLKEKYPDKEIEITDIYAAGLLGTNSIYRFTINGDSDIYAAQRGNNGEFEDNYLGKIAAPIYSDFIYKNLCNNGFEIVGVNATASIFTGKETGSNTNINKILSEDSQFTFVINIYAVNPNSQPDIEEIQKIKNYIVQNNLYGYFYINCSSTFTDMTVEECRQIIADNEAKVECISFSLDRNAVS